jgi:alpha-beta hydrolase superfamily lysophospholipase
MRAASQGRGGLLLRVAFALVALAVVGVAAGWWLARPAVPDAFYDPPLAIPSQPGLLMREAPFERALPAGALAWRILYTTTDAQGKPTLASALVMLARNAPPGPRPVIAWTHGTTGAVPGCAPSLLDEPFANVPALAPLLERGWLMIATDYAGQAAAGVHPYLIGEGEARSALDAVRAARRMREPRASEQTVVWGHSQGGHAALWTGILAPSYAPDVALAGVAAAAPASDLRPLIDAVQHTPVGRIMTSYVMRAYAGTYPDVRWNDYVGGALAGVLARDMGNRCLAGRKALYSAAQAIALGGSIFSAPPSAGALGERLAQNTPDRPLAPPLLVAQGDADDLVLPAVQTRWVARRCAAGQALEYRRYAGLDHLTLVAADSPFSADLVRWTEDRFAGRPAASACPPH